MEYTMEQKVGENESMPKFEPINPIKMSSKIQKSSVNFVRVWNPDNIDEYFHIFFNAPLILSSAMGVNRVKNPEQMRTNIDDFILYLRKMLKRHEVTERVEIISFNHGLNLRPQNPSIYEIIKSHFGDDSFDCFQLNWYNKDKHV